MEKSQRIRMLKYASKSMKQFHSETKQMCLLIYVCSVIYSQNKLVSSFLTVLLNGCFVQESAKVWSLWVVYGVMIAPKYRLGFQLQNIEEEDN